MMIPSNITNHITIATSVQSIAVWCLFFLNGAALSEKKSNQLFNSICLVSFQGAGIVQAGCLLLS